MTPTPSQPKSDSDFPYVSVDMVAAVQKWVAMQAPPKLTDLTAEQALKFLAERHGMQQVVELLLINHRRQHESTTK
jgi:hypothetical protein